MKSATLTALAIALGCGSANARPARCLLRVEGHTYINRVCNFEADKDGSFTVGVDERTLTSFAYVNMNGDGTANATWNGVERESHAQQDLGTLHRDSGDEACWINPTARICAW